MATGHDLRFSIDMSGISVKEAAEKLGIHFLQLYDILEGEFIPDQSYYEICKVLQLGYVNNIGFIPTSEIPNLVPGSKEWQEHMKKLYGKHR